MQVFAGKAAIIDVPIFSCRDARIPVEIVGAGEVHAAFLNESRTRGHVQRSVQEIRDAATGPSMAMRHFAQLGVEHVLLR